jgi:hypothetical protein
MQVVNDILKVQGHTMDALHKQGQQIDRVQGQLNKVHCSS